MLIRRLSASLCQTMIHLYVALLSGVLLFSAFPTFVHADPVNVTIDDTFGDENTGAQIVYNPASAWTQGNICRSCTARPDATQAYHQTWHDTTYYPANETGANAGVISSATANFTGTAVYVYCILVRSLTSPTGTTDMTFFLDGERVTTFSLTADGNRTYLYDQLVFLQDGLDGDVEHSLRLENGHADVKALVMLDRIVYTTDDSLVSTTRIPVATWTTIDPLATSSTPNTFTPLANPTTGGFLTSLSALPTDGSSASSTNPSSSSDSSTGTIVGATLGSLAGVFLMIGSWWMCVRRSRMREDETAQVIQPFFAPRSGYGRRSDGSRGGSSGRVRFVGGGLAMSEDSNSYRGRTYFSLPPFARRGVPGAEAQAKGSRTLATTGTPSPITPTTLDTPSSAGSFPHSRADANAHPYAVNVRSEKMRLLQARNLQNRSQSPAGTGGHNQRQGSRRNVSPFSPTPLYMPTQGEENDLLSPSTASIPMSVAESTSQTRPEGTANTQEQIERIRRWNTSRRVNGNNATDAHVANYWDDDVNALLEPVSPHALLRPNRRRDPAPLDDPLSNRPNPPPRPHRSRGRPLTRILEINAHSDADSARAEAQETRVGTRADSDEDVRWQQKLVNIFTPSSVVGGGGGVSAPPLNPVATKKKGKALPIPPGANPLDAPSRPALLPLRRSEKSLPAPPGMTEGAGVTSTPPPPYYGQTRK